MLEGLPDQLVRRALKVMLVLKVIPELQALLVLKVIPEHRVLEVYKVLRGIQELRV